MDVNGNLGDNASAGGITCGIKENSQLKDVAYSKYGIKFDRHPRVLLLVSVLFFIW